MPNEWWKWEKDQGSKWFKPSSLQSGPWLITIKIFFFYWSALFFWWWTWGLQFPCPHTLLIPFQSGSWPLITTLNLTLSMLPMIHSFLKLVVCLHPGFIWFTRSIWHSSLLLDIFFQLTFRTEYFLGFFPICWSCTLVSISASFSSLWLLKLKEPWA